MPMPKAAPKRKATTLTFTTMTMSKWGAREDDFVMKTRWIIGLYIVQVTKIHLTTGVGLYGREAKIVFLP